jgi:ubiquinone/menaquinone biosynthesis C-methylase UbiE
MIPPEQIYNVEGQRVDLTNVDLPGRILDIGGGGEGMIGRVFGERVVAIDLLRQELEEAPPGPLKIVMDARKLQFLDGMFDATTAFFALMYIANADHEQVLTEVHRVLKPGGWLLIWDVTIPAERPSNKQALMVSLEVVLPGWTARPGYGIAWQDRHQDARYFSQLAHRLGFEPVAQSVSDRVFTLRLRKKA